MSIDPKADAMEELRAAVDLRIDPVIIPLWTARALLAGEGPAPSMAERLPCDVTLAPGTVFRKGVAISTLLAAIERRRLQVNTVEPPYPFGNRP